MKTIIKVLALTLIAALMLSVFAGCGSKEDTVEPTYDNVPEPEYKAVTIDEQVLYESADFKITAVSLDYDTYGSPLLNVKIDNNLKDIAIAPQLSLIVNGVYFQNLSSADMEVVNPASSDTFAFDLGIFCKMANISTIKDIIADITVYDVDVQENGYSVNSALVEDETAAITTSADPAYVQEFNYSGDSIYDKDGIKFIVQENYKNADGFVGKRVFIENLSGKDINFETNKFVINGKDRLEDNTFYLYVPANTRLFATVDTQESDAKTLQFAFNILDVNDNDKVLDTTSALEVTF